MVLGFLSYWALHRNLSADARLDEAINLFRWPLDFQVYFEAVGNMEMGRNLYEQDWIGILPFTYPPFAAVAMRLFFLTDFQAAAIIWQVSSALVLAAVIAACFRQRGYAWGLGLCMLTLLTFFASFNFVSIQGTFYFGQINIMLMGLVAWDFLGNPQRKYRGIGTGLAAGLKLTPAFHGMLFLIERRWWAGLVSFGVFLLSVGIGFWQVPDASSFWTGKMTDTDRIGQNQDPGALSLKSMFIRREWPLETFFWVLGVALVLYLFFIGASAAIRRNNYVMALGLSGTAAALVSPFSWYHHWVYSVPLAIALMDGLRRIFVNKLQRLPNGTATRLLQECVGCLVGVAVILAFLPQASWTSLEGMHFLHLSESSNWFVQEMHIYFALLMLGGIAAYYALEERKQNAS